MGVAFFVYFGSFPLCFVIVLFSFSLNKEEREKRRERGKGQEMSSKDTSFSVFFFFSSFQSFSYRIPNFVCVLFICNALQTDLLLYPSNVVSNKKMRPKTT